MVEVVRNWLVISALLCACYIFMLMTKGGFEAAFTGSVSWRSAFGLWMLYLLLPLLISLSGVGLLGLSNQEVLRALPPTSPALSSTGGTVPQDAVRETGWGAKVAVGAAFSSILIVAITRVLARLCYSKSMTRSVYIASIVSVVLLASYAFLRARYLEVLFEGVFTMGFVVPFFLLATGVGATTEAMLHVVAKTKIPGDCDT